MKHKAAVGCLIVVVLLGAGVTAGGYAVYRKVRSGVGRLAGLATVRELERDVRDQSTYSSPPSGELTRAQVDRLLQVQAAVRSRLGDRVAAIERKYQAYLDKKVATAADFSAAVSAYGDLAAAFVDGKRAHVEALNAAGFSLSEYRWVRAQAYAALDLTLMDLDLARLMGGAGTEQLPAAREPSAPADSSGRIANRNLVTPHRKTIEDYLVLAFFGF